MLEPREKRKFESVFGIVGTDLLKGKKESESAMKWCDGVSSCAVSPPPALIFLLEPAKAVD